VGLFSGCFLGSKFYFGVWLRIFLYCCVWKGWGLTLPVLEDAWFLWEVAEGEPCSVSCFGKVEV
jgi:hypothetical protein